MTKGATRLLTLGGVIGVFVVGFFSIKSYHDSLDKLAELDIDLEDEENPPTTSEILEATWKCWIPTGIAVAVTEACILGSNQAHLRTEAALAGVAAAVGTQLKKLDRGMLEELGKEKYSELKAAIHTKEAAKVAKKEKLDKLEKDHANDDGDVYYDAITGQYFWATEADILRAEIALNKTFQRENEVTVADYVSFFNNKNLNINPSDDDWGWYLDDTFDELANYNQDGYYISLEMNPGEVDGDHQAIIIVPSIAPADPSAEYREYMEKKYEMYKPEPGDQLELPLAC